MSSLIPPPVDTQKLLPLSEDLSVMSQAKQQRHFLRQFKRAVDDYKSKNPDVSGQGLYALVTDQLNGTPQQQMMVMGMVGKVMAAELASPDPAEKKAFDAPWLTRSRLAYQDPQRLAEVRAQNHDTVVDVQAKTVTK